MNPGETTTVRMQVQSPILTSGKLDMMVQFWADGVEEIQSNQTISIVPRSGGDLGLTNIDCMFEVKPGDTRLVELFIENTGDASYMFNLSVTEKPDWLVVNITEYNWIFRTRSNSPRNRCICLDGNWARGGTDWRSHNRIEVDGWVPAEVSFDVSIAAVHAWDIIRSDAEVIDGKLTGYWK